MRAAARRAAAPSHPAPKDPTAASLNLRLSVSVFTHTPEVVSPVELASEDLVQVLVEGFEVRPQPLLQRGVEVVVQRPRGRVGMHPLAGLVAAAHLQISKSVSSVSH